MEHVTVVIPTRNRRRVLAQVLRAVLGQRDVVVRAVVVDEGSSDDTARYLTVLQDDRVEVVRHDPPKGLAAARNAGLERVRTHWVAFCDDDDLWAPEKLAAQLTAVAATPGARWSCVGTVSVDPSMDIVGHQRPPESGDISELMRAHNAVPGGGSGLLAETELVRAVGGYDAWPTGCEDFDMAVKLSLRAPVACVDRPLVAYRVWPGSMSTDVDKMRTGHERVMERHRGDLRADLARQGDLIKEAYLGRFHLRSGRRVAGFRHYLRLAVRFGRRRQLVTAVGALVVPGVLAARHHRRERDAVPAEWRDEARRWIDAEVADVAAVE